MLPVMPLIAVVYLAAAVMAASVGKNVTTPSLGLLPSPSSIDPPCPTGEQWSKSGGLCCPVCAAGTGAIGACAAISTLGVPVNNNNSTLERTVANGCELCIESVSYSDSFSHDQPCRTCNSCPKNARTISACNVTHDTLCECEAGLFYLSQRSDQCELCDLCPAGWGARTACGVVNTLCHKCQNGTYSDVLSATAACEACSVCTEGQRMLQECTATQDTICISKYMDIPPMYRSNGDNNYHDLDLGRGHSSGDADDRQNRRNLEDDDDGIDVIPLYCAALGAVVVGLLAYVALVHYRRMRDKRLSREPHEDVEYSKASGADSGVFADMDSHHHQQKYHCVLITGGTRLRDIPQNKRKELEKTFLAGSRSPADWKALARELGYNTGKIANFESQGSRDPGAPYRHVVHEWSRLEGATVTAFLRALRNIGRHDVVKFLQAECGEQLQPLTALLPQNVV